VVKYQNWKHFQRYKDDPAIVSAAEIIKEIRDILHDNGPILDYLLNQKEFPAKDLAFQIRKVKFIPRHF